MASGLSARLRVRTHASRYRRAAARAPRRPRRTPAATGVATPVGDSARRGSGSLHEAKRNGISKNRFDGDATGCAFLSGVASPEKLRPGRDIHVAHTTTPHATFAGARRAAGAALAAAVGLFARRAPCRGAANLDARAWPIRTRHSQSQHAAKTQTQTHQHINTPRATAYQTT